jgi:glutathione S-transferase
MKLYYSPGACSLAPHIALEETGAEYEPLLVKLADGAQRRPDYLAVNPKGRVPALADDGFVVTENPAILRYIARQHPTAALWPDDPRAEARCMEWLGWCASTIHVSYAHVRRPERYATADAAKADVVEKGRETCRDVWSQVETRLAAAASTWAAGETYSVADPYIFTFWTWGRGPALGFDMGRDFPAWTAHAKRMGERPAVQRALAREGIAQP